MSSLKRDNVTNWKAIFRLHSWWLDPGKKRLFVIVQRWHDDDGKIEAVELLQEKQERSKKIPLAEMISFFEKGLLVVTSLMDL